MAKLSVNVNKIATLRNSRGGEAPVLMPLVHQIVGWGAEGITVHPRADRRHITPDDARAVAREVRKVEVNFEGDIREEFLDLVLECVPSQCTLVPVKPGEITSNHGWDVDRWSFLLEGVIRRIRDAGVRVSLFVEAGDVISVRRAADLGAQRIELYTEPYAAAHAQKNCAAELDRLVVSAEAARSVGLGINAGHDLTCDNLPRLITAIPDMAEVSIGHHLLCDALVSGLKNAVRSYLAASKNPS